MVCTWVFVGVEGKVENKRWGGGEISIGHYEGRTEQTSISSSSRLVAKKKRGFGVRNGRGYKSKKQRRQGKRLGVQRKGERKKN